MCDVQGKQLRSGTGRSVEGEVGGGGSHVAKMGIVLVMMMTVEGGV